MINSRKVEDLAPAVQVLALAFKAACAAKGYDIIFTSTLRDNECQASLYAVGRTVKGANPRLLKPMGDVVTNAKPGDSYHNYAVAFDFCPIVNGKAAWDDASAFAECGSIAESIGLEWSGRWDGKLKETAHCQFTGGLTIADFKSGKTLGA